MLQSYAEASKSQCVFFAPEKSLCQKPMLLGTDSLTATGKLCCQLPILVYVSSFDRDCRIPFGRNGDMHTNLFTTDTIHCRWPSTYQRIMRMGTVTVTLGSQARLCFCCKLAEANLKVNFPTKTQLSGTSSDQKHASQRILLQLLAIVHQQMQGGCKETRLCWAEECLRNCDILAHSRTSFMSTRTRRSPVSEAGRISSYSI